MSKSAEAISYVKKAEKCMKTSFLKWSPDTEGALNNYTKAAECFKEANDMVNAIDMYKKVSDMYLESESLFYGAKALEDAANCYKILKDYKNMVDLILIAGDKLRVNGNSDSATQLMKKTAKTIEEDEPGAAARLYMFACEAAQDKDSMRDAGEFAGLAAKLFVRTGNFEDCEMALKVKADMLSRSGVFHEAGKAVVCRVLLCLQRNDLVAAQKTFSSCIELNSFGSTDDSSPINQLLSAVDRGDYDEARRILKMPTFMYLENDFVKLARNIKFPEVSKVVGNAQSGDETMVMEEDIN